MSRSGYTDDFDESWQLGQWRGVIASATRGKRGQAFFRALVTALDAMPQKRLAKNALATENAVCAFGALGRARGMDLDDLEYAVENGDYEALGDAFGIAPALTQEVMYINDERCERDTPEGRWEKVRLWAAEQIIPTEAELSGAP